MADPDDLARQWHVLMKGSIVAAGEGDTEAALRARRIGQLLLLHEGVLATPGAARDSPAALPARRAAKPAAAAVTKPARSARSR